MNKAYAVHRYSIFIAALLVSSFGAAVSAQTLVAVETVESQSWQQTLTLYGTLTSPRSAQLTPRVAGLVAETHVEAGDMVATGDALITLDSKLARLTLNETEAAATQARAELGEARRLNEQLRELSGTGAVSETEIEARASAVSVAQANLTRARAAAARQREIIDRHVLVAPFTGTVAARLVEPGEYIAESIPAVTLVATDRLRMDVRAPQQYYATLQAGMPVVVEPDAYEERRFNARLDVKVPDSDPTARSFLTRIYLDNVDGALTPGMSAKVLFEIESSEPVVVAPRDALLRELGGGTRMWVVSRGEGKAGKVLRVDKRQVTIGRSDGDLVEVVSGLKAGERVVVRGNEGLSAGQEVRLQSDPGDV